MIVCDDPWRVASAHAEFWHDFAFEFVTTTIALLAVVVIAARALLRPRSP